MTRPLLFRLVSVVACAVGFYLPLAVVPMFAGSAGAESSAGWANAALLLATVATEMATPAIVSRFGYRRALVAGLALLGTPILLLLTPAGTALVVVLAVNVVRGAGFAICVVAGGALTAALIPTERRGEGLALVGLVGGVPALLALPLGTWAAPHWGYGAVFVVTALVPLAAVVTVPALPARDASSEASHGLGRGLRRAALVRPAAIFAASASAAGVVVTFLPLAVADEAGWVAPTALLLQPAAATLARWAAGRLGDRRGQTRLLVPGVSLSAIGMAAMAATGSGILVTIGAAVFGGGFGLLQNATLSLMYARVAEQDYGTVSAIWNGAYDLGMGAGSIGVGAVLSVSGFGVAFLLVAATILPALVLARSEGRPARRPAGHRTGHVAVAA
ncbi:Predicted arabinose efflux permease, MFS family [Nocardioides terrae]|uniref:Predicted arabinose efflux permease, MFS family n=2 Tax=Nocardioides terrae TaxID=574651 RepID=A0A1I1FMY5_9ACTN|nr:Predicted arabinose efflux permease, MFS family [Nocardioides terrae]